MKSRATIRIEEADRVLSVGGSEFIEPFLIVSGDWDHATAAMIFIDGADEFQMKRLADLIKDIRKEIASEKSIIRAAE